MTPEKWRRITAVFHAARTHDVEARGRYLDEECAGDVALRAEVDAMLVADGEAGQFGNTPLFELAATRSSVKPGETLGAYRIGTQIGAGGMGEVYRAHDPRLDRAVAIKILHAGPLADPDARQQLLREARSAAALNHPNICTIHEIGEAGPQAYIVMELIEGAPLDRLTSADGFPVEDALRYGIAIADAMTHAHQRGILHGDLKPANVVISRLGIPKILDFGLAKLLPASAQASTACEANVPFAPVMRGTPAYVSPEQVLGHPTDERSDIFSFGAMLYEMVTGKPPFDGATPRDVLDAVLHKQPAPIATIRPDAPSVLSQVVQKALAKDPSERYQRMSELAADLRGLHRPRFGIKPRTVAIGAAAAVGLIALVVLFVSRFDDDTSERAPPRITQLTTLPGLEYSPTWSPDGRAIAYASNAAGNLDIYVQQIDSGQVTRLTDSEADDAQPAWSPDGTRIAFMSSRAYPDKRLAMLIGMSRLQSVLPLRNGDVWVMSALGGTARRIAKNADDPAWSPDGKQIVYGAVRDGVWGLWIQEVDTLREPRRLVIGDVNVRLGSSVFETPALPMIQPAWSTDGKWIAFAAGRSFLRVFVVPSEGGQASAVTPADTNSQMPSWTPDGRWLYFSSERSGRTNLFRVGFRNGRFGPTLQVTTGPGADLQARLHPQGKQLAYSSVRDVLDLWEYDLTSRESTRLTSETTDEDNARPSPDGQWLAFASNRLNGNHLWLLNRLTGNLTQVSIASSYTLQGFSRWSWDSKYLFYSRASDESGSTFWQYEVSTDATRQVYEGAADLCVSADDRYLIVGLTSGNFMRVELASAKKEAVGRVAAGVPGDLVCSPDGQWVAFHVHRGDDRDIWLMSLVTGIPRLLSAGDHEDSHPAWSADSSIVYFVRNHQDVYAAPLAGGEPKPVTEYRAFNITLDYPAVSGDGEKILFTRTDKAGDIYLLEQVADD